MAAGAGSGRSAWHDRLAPSLDELAHLAEEAFADLPERFRSLCAGIVIKVEDFPTDDVLDELGAETPFDLLGLFQGIGRAQQGAVAQTGQMPNMVFLYRRPILDYWAEHEETLGDLVTHVLVHEIGHHFGLSDDDMAEVEDRAN
ncbi:metallopeptidase family protein [Xanthobacter autotrophicus DSM 431]|uniref:metallopeptidase family protein n=1 Tax=Xanthobacter nonsaccharivorans TaxID=3119912 RepID=UPI00372B2508